MGPGVNICAFVVGLAAFAGGAVPRFAAPRRVRSINFLGGVRSLALFFAIVSPNDDGFQQMMIGFCLDRLCR
jgi:hypothetical protein